jgi:hypothetical protein
MNKRKLKLDSYGISDKRYKELCGFCEQYPEWKDELMYHTCTVKSIGIMDMPFPPPSVHHPTEELAIRREELRRKCEMVEQTAIEADADLYRYIIESVCYEKPFRYLEGVMEIPCCARSFFDARRFFFYILDKNKKM